MTKPRDIPTSGPVQYEVARPFPTRCACGGAFCRPAALQCHVCYSAGHPGWKCGACGETMPGTPPEPEPECSCFAGGPRDALHDDDCPHFLASDLLAPAPCLCTAPDRDADHSGRANDPGPMSPAEADRILREAGIDPVAATARMMARCFPDPLRAPGRCFRCGGDRVALGQHPVLADHCFSHGEIWAANAKRERVL